MRYLTVHYLTVQCIILRYRRALNSKQFSPCRTQLKGQGYKSCLSEWSQWKAVHCTVKPKWQPAQCTALCPVRLPAVAAAAISAVQVYLKNYLHPTEGCLQGYQPTHHLIPNIPTRWTLLGSLTWTACITPAMSCIARCSQHISYSDKNPSIWPGVLLDYPPDIAAQTIWRCLYFSPPCQITAVLKGVEHTKYWLKSPHGVQISTTGNSCFLGKKLPKRPIFGSLVHSGTQKNQIFFFSYFDSLFILKQMHSWVILMHSKSGLNQ